MRGKPRSGRGLLIAGLKVGDAVAEMSFGAYSEWAVVEQKFAIPVPTCSPEIVALLTSGLTASIGGAEFLHCAFSSVDVVTDAFDAATESA